MKLATDFIKALNKTLEFFRPKKFVISFWTEKLLLFNLRVLLEALMKFVANFIYFE
jgi:hypothetical protein